MTRRLLLLRHAQAVTPGAGDDAARALSPAGHDEATRIGHAMAAHDLRPDAAVVSPAVRTRQTIEDVTTASGFDIPVETVAALYNATIETLLDLVRTTDDAVDCLLVVGHNPTMADTLQHLTAAPAPLAFPTAGLAVLQAPIGHWADLERADIAAFLLPTDAALA